jgi:hypothetical protein
MRAVAMPASGRLEAAPLPLTGTVGFDGVVDAFHRPGSLPTDAKIIVDPTA